MIVVIINILLLLIISIRGNYDLLHYPKPVLGTGQVGSAQMGSLQLLYVFRFFLFCVF